MMRLFEWRQYEWSWWRVGGGDRELPIDIAGPPGNLHPCLGAAAAVGRVIRTLGPIAHALVHLPEQNESI
jgi:hypothetical protein